MLNLIEIEDFYELPAHVYLKDRRGIYQGSNDYVAKRTGLDHYKGNNFINITDYDVCFKEIAHSFQEVDQTVLNKETSINLIENVKFFCGLKYKVMTYKQPVFNNRKRVVGVLGISFMLSHPDNDALDLSIFENSKQKPSKDNQVDIYLTPRQIDCLYHLTLGKTAKQIGVTLNLSQRTIEYYINNLKEKLGCHSRYELISKALKFPIIKNKINFSILYGT